jgi:hypothetical protein
VEGGEAGGGRRWPAQWRPGELHQQWEAEQGRQGNRAEEHVCEEEEEREGVRGAYLEISKTSGTSR